MNYSLKERFKMWICRTFGHSFDPSKEWTFNGMDHNTCERCRHIVSKESEK